MFKVKILTIGRCKETWLQEALAEYEKRLKNTVVFEWHLAKNEEQLTAWGQAEPFLLLLDLQGELLNSERFSQKLSALFIEKGARLTFVIGGAEGIPFALFQKPHYRWSLSPLTFTHQMVRLLLVEQIYRALQIAQGTGYHK